MASVHVEYTFKFTPDEVAILLKLVGRESRSSVADLGLDIDAFEGLWATLTEAAYRPMREDAP